MGHKVLVNTSKKPIKHPITGQLIPGGHSYTVPDDEELKAQEKMQKAWEKADAKAKSDADEAAKLAEEEQKKKDAEEAERLKAEEEAHAKLLEQQNAAANGNGTENSGGVNEPGQSD